jgi:hypothetical protein
LGIGDYQSAVPKTDCSEKNKKKARREDVFITSRAEGALLYTLHPKRGLQTDLVAIAIVIHIACAL